MTKERLNAFSDGVIAILITIMVLELRQPEGTSWSDLRGVLPTLGAYVLSFAFLGVYWNNHHHMLNLVRRVDGTVLWANNVLLFALSLIPFTTTWMSENDFATVPTAVYGIVLVACGLSYVLLQSQLMRSDGPASLLRGSLGRDRKGPASLVLYLAGIGLTFANHWVGLAVYTVVALMWVVPDRRLERVADEAPAG